MTYKSAFKIPNELYHYTTLETLLNIVQNKDVNRNSFLRLTNINYLNDRNESLEAIIQVENKNTGIDLSSWKKRKRIQNLFVFSMSEESDLLSQWRGYSNSETGICIGFDPKYFQDLSDSDDGIFEKVQYSYEGFEEIAAPVIKEYEHGDVFIFYKQFFKIMLFHKNKAWSEEKEWRLVMSPPDNNARKCTIKNGCIAPYIEVPIPFGSQVITSIRIQQRNDKDDVKYSIKKFMNEWGFPIKDIDVSSIPIQ